MPCRTTLQDPQPVGAREQATTRRNALVLVAASVSCAAFNDVQAQAANNGRTARDPGSVASLLRAGGCAVLLRHAATDPGVGDPPDFKLETCSTQRNLSGSGREDAQRIGAWFRNNKFAPRAVLSSAWCRCKDTADLAFGRHTVWAALNSTFSDRILQPDQTAALRRSLARIPARQFEVWVTHQVNISALTGQGTAMGEALVLDQAGRVVARSVFD